MSKRRAGNELTRDNWDDEEEKVEVGMFKTADEDVLKNRVVRKAKRTLQRDESGEMKPLFSGFSGFKNFNSNTNSKQAFSFLSKCNEIPSEAGNHPSASTINSMSTSSSLKFSDNNYSKSSTPVVINPLKVMKLNEAFVKFVTNAIQADPYCVLTPTLRDYEKQIGKFININACKTSTSGSSMTSKENPQISSSFENTEIRTKNSDEVKNNSVNVETDLSSFTTFKSPTSTSNNPSSFDFSEGYQFKIRNKNANKSLKLDDETEEKITKNIEVKLPSVSSKESNKLPTTSEFKLDYFKFDQNLCTSIIGSKPSELTLDGKTTSPSSKPSEMKFNMPAFNFGSTASTFPFKPMELKNDNKPMFTFGVKSPDTKPTFDSSKNTEVEKSKDEDDEDQPPVVNFTPVKENDAIFESKSKLYYLENGKYEEHGVGQLYLKQVDDKKIQLIMRNDSALGTIMVNTLLNESINFTKRNAKNVQLICVVDPTKSTKPQTVLFKFKDSQITDSFEKELSKLKKN